MGIKKNLLILMIYGNLLGMSCTAWASSTGGETPKEIGQSEIWAGVKVDYIRKLRFQVLEEGTNSPIPDSSIEIYVPSLNRFVLFGVTDDDGIYELEAANGSQEVPADDQFNTAEDDATFQSPWLYMRENHISYRIYKADWLPYPYEGDVDLTTAEVPQIVTVYLHKKTSGGGSSGHVKPNAVKPNTAVPSSEAYMESIDETEAEGGEDTGVIPKTGVEGITRYLAAGLIFFLFAGGILWYLSGKE